MTILTRPIPTEKCPECGDQHEIIKRLVGFPLMTCPGFGGKRLMYFYDTAILVGDGKGKK